MPRVHTEFLSDEFLGHRTPLPPFSRRGDLAGGIDDYLESLSELHVAVTHHLEWLKGIHHTLLLDRVADPADLALDAAHRCRFGRWYEGEVPDPLRDMNLFTELGARHETLHGAARELLTGRRAQRKFDPILYAGFMDRVLEFNAYAQRLHMEVLTALAVRDPLPGVLNRGIMRNQLQAEWARFERFGQPCALVMLDLDRFKDINDRFGHRTGDAVLREVASTLAKRLRAYDNIFFRFGGEEFLICLPGIAPETLPLALALERMRGTVQDLRLAHEGGEEIRVTASLGAAFFESGADLDRVLKRADEALYAAKRSGRNRFRIAGSPREPGATPP